LELGSDSELDSHSDSDSLWESESVHLALARASAWVTAAVPDLDSVPASARALDSRSESGSAMEFDSASESQDSASGSQSEPGLAS